MRARPVGLFCAVLFGFSLGMSGCTAPMNDSCDGANPGPACQLSCATSARCPAGAPICDADEATCRACAPGEDSLCQKRGLDAPHCVSGRCVACVTPRGIPAEVADCGVDSPICDANACRPCSRHAECASGVCNKDDSGAASGLKMGSCVPAAQVLIVDQDLCSRSGPIYCTPQQAFADVDAQHRFVLLRRGAAAEDFTSLSFGDIPDQVGPLVRIIGPLADGPPQHSPGLPPVMIGSLPGKNGLNVSHGKVILEGLFVRNNRIGIGCTGSDANVQIVRSFFSGNSTAISLSGGCKLSVSECWIGSGPVSSGLAGLPGNARGIDVTAAELHVVNSVFTDNGDYAQDALGGIRIHGLAGDASTVVNTTFFQLSGLLKGGQYLTTLMCDAPVGDRLIFANSLFLGDGPLSLSPEEHYFDASCGARVDHLASNDRALLANGGSPIDADRALFVDSKGRDLRPVLGQDAAHLALQSGGTRSLTVSGQNITAPMSDLDGVTRAANGDQVAIGAFEPVPAQSP